MLGANAGLAKVAGAARLAAWLVGCSVGSLLALGAIADLRNANFRGAILNDSSLFNTNFEGADLRGADLRQASGLTQAQVNTMITDESTKLPAGLHPSAPR